MVSKEVVAITGAGSGLGKALALKYSQKGYYVCLLGRTKAKLLETGSQCRGPSSIYELDVTHTSNLNDVIKNLLEDHHSIDYWINNAGVGIFKSVLDLTENDIHQMIDTNLKGTIFCTQQVLKVMINQKKGCIINIISNSGKEAKAFESVYGSSKFGIRGFSEALAIECKDSGVNILSAYMGNMRTNLWKFNLSKEQMESYMSPDQVADLIFESAKHQTSITGEDITIVNHNGEGNKNLV